MLVRYEVDSVIPLYATMQRDIFVWTELAFALQR
jgi:hypothetical protein